MLASTGFRIDRNVCNMYNMAQTPSIQQKISLDIDTIIDRQGHADTFSPLSSPAQSPEADRRRLSCDTLAEK